MHSKQIIWHWSFWTQCWSLVTRQIFEHVLDPRWRFVYSYFYTAILHLFQTFIFRRKLLNLLKELWELFYHSFIFFDEQALTFTRYKIFRLCMYYSIDFILILPMYQCQYATAKTADLFMEQKRIPHWNILSLENSAFCEISVIFLLLIEICNLFLFCSHRWIAVRVCYCS